MGKKMRLTFVFSVMIVMGAIAFFFLQPGCSPAPEKDIRVPPAIKTAAGTFTTIQEALDAAQPGETIIIPAGVYAESLRITKSLRLEGAGCDKTIISLPHTQRSAMTVRRSAEVLISGLKVEHSDTHRADEELGDRPELIRVLDAKATIEDCIIGPGIGCGILVDEQGICMLKNTLVENNHHYGLFVRIEGTKAQASGATLRDNKEGGILATKAASLDLEDSTIAHNGKWGVRAMNEGTTLNMKNNKILQNQGPGTQLEMRAIGLVEDNEYRENQSNAIFFTYGATGIVKNNLCVDNQGFGVNVQSISTRVDVLDNRCTGNKDSGVIMEFGASGTVSGNHCEGNSWDGILVANWVSAPVVTNNHCINNKRHGILFCLGAAGEADGNYCAGNGSHGFAVLDELTEVKLGSNKGENNGGEDFIQLAETPASQQHQIELYQIVQALLKEQFDSLEIIADRLREHKPVYPHNGAEQASTFYRALIKGMGTIGPHSPEIFTPIFERWKEAYPDSVTPCVALAELHLRYGWIARGSGYTHTVTPEGWETLKKELSIAREYLLQAEKINPRELRVCILGMEINRGLDNDRLLAKQWYDKGLEIDPYSFDLHFDRAFGLLERWKGKKGELARFMLELYEQTREKCGARLYKDIAISLVTCMADIYLDEEIGLDWDILERGCKEMLEEKPEWTHVLYQYFALACMYHKQELAKELLDRIGDENHLGWWERLGAWEDWKAWANKQGEAPRALKRPSGGLMKTILNAVEYFLFESDPESEEW
ncbi:MAG: hypothetical protein GX130_12210 [Candidatus Hydrogenedens sp.]|jgi:parallel beta-helix repeat protein|nr:hypothetical protein [Candidatus Hydrogenedens sp.]